MDGGRNNASVVPLRNILAATFCANRDYTLVLFDRLPSDQQELLRDLTKDPEFYGVLLPPPNTLRKPKSACQSTALLLYSLMEPGPIPAYVQTSLGAGANQSIAELVLDEVLMIEHEGVFICGSAAYDLLYSEPHAHQTTTPLSNLTRSALEYGQMLALEDPTMLSARLYAYNRVPLSPRWKRLLPDRDAAAKWLGIDRSGELRPLLEDRWDYLAPSAQLEGWFQWSSRSQPTRNGDTETPTRNDVPETSYKLYVSPAPEATQQAFKAVVECLANSEAYHFKAGDDGYGLPRPGRPLHCRPPRQHASVLGRRSSAPERRSRLAGARELAPVDHQPHRCRHDFCQPILQWPPRPLALRPRTPSPRRYRHRHLDAAPR